MINAHSNAPKGHEALAVAFEPTTNRQEPTASIAQSNEAATTAWADSLVMALEHQQTMVDRLLALSDAQVHSITSGRTEELLEVLAQRQAIIDGMIDGGHAGQEQMAQLTRSLDKRISQAAPQQRKRIEMLIADIGHKLAQVMQRDEQDQARLRQARDQTQQELSTLGTGKQARHAYGQAQMVGATGGSVALNNRYSDQRG